MKKVDFLIVGGSAAGTTAAEVIRTLKPNDSIVIVHEEEHEQYSRVLLPHYIRHKVEREQVFLKKPQWYLEKKIELMRGVKAVNLDSNSKRVKLSNGEEFEYGKVLIAVGGSVIRINFPGVSEDSVCYFRTIENADRIIEKAKAAKSGLIVGGGFIGLEFASCFKVNGVEEVNLLVREEYFWEGKLDKASSQVLVSVLERNGVNVLVGEEVERFESNQGQSLSQVAVTKSGKNLPADVVGIGVGIKSDLGFLEGSGVKVDRGIVANEYLETNVSDVYAAGDCAQFWDVIFEREHSIGNWANATSQGNSVGKTMADVRTVFETASSYSINFFDPPAGKAGGSCSFIGVTEEGFADKIVTRGSVESGKMARIFIKTIDNVMRVVGATIINDPSEVSPISAAVRSKTDISAHIDNLSDLNFDLREIVQPI